MKQYNIVYTLESHTSYGLPRMLTPNGGWYYTQTDRNRFPSTKRSIQTRKWTCSLRLPLSRTAHIRIYQQRQTAHLFVRDTLWCKHALWSVSVLVIVILCHCQSHAIWLSEMIESNTNNIFNSLLDAPFDHGNTQKYVRCSYFGFDSTRKPHWKMGNWNSLENANLNNKLRLCIFYRITRSRHFLWHFVFAGFPRKI